MTESIMDDQGVWGIIEGEAVWRIRRRRIMPVEMSIDPVWLGSVGVGLLLTAFALSLIGRLDSRARAYYLLNALGAGLAAAASWQIGFLPFVVLEGTWCAVAVIALVRSAGRRAHDVNC
jgi:hypothetical protein